MTQQIILLQFKNAFYKAKYKVIISLIHKSYTIIKFHLFSYIYNTYKLYIHEI